MTTELKPCPFCGGKVDPEGWIGSGRKGPECEECGATANGVMQWNTRAVPDVPELVRYNKGTFGHLAPFDKGDYVRYDQASAMLAALKAELYDLRKERDRALKWRDHDRERVFTSEADNKLLRDALETLVDRISYYASLAEEGIPNIEDWAYTDNSGDIAKARAALGGVDRG